MVSQVPGAQGDTQGLLSVSGSGIHPVQAPVESLTCPKLTHVLPPRGRDEKKTQICRHHQGGTLQQPSVTGEPAVQALRGQEACPRSQSKCTGNPSRPLLQAGSASERLALSLGSCEVTSSGVMGHKTQSPAHVRGPRCQSGSEGTEKGLAGLKITCQERLGGRRTRAYTV